MGRPPPGTAISKPEQLFPGSRRTTSEPAGRAPGSARCAPLRRSSTPTCHLDITERYSGLSPSDALAAAAAVGVTGVVQVGVDVASSRRSVGLAAEFDSVVAAVALHPNEAPDADLSADLAAIAELSTDPRVVAIGETGLDHYRTDRSGQTAQESSFREHIRLARDRDLTLVIHDRDAHSDVLRVACRRGPARSGGVPLLQRRCRDGRRVCRQWVVPVLPRCGSRSRTHNRCGMRRRSPARADAGGDGCAVPDPVPARGSPMRPT